MTIISLQKKFAPFSQCFGCGPANADGLRLSSVVDGDQVIAHWRPREHHQAFPGMLNGGIIGTLLDCHSNWTAAWHLMRQRGAERPACTVTAEYAIKLLRPTPLDLPLDLVARVVSHEERRVTVEAILTAAGEARATCRGIFVEVQPGHPAYHQW